MPAKNKHLHGSVPDSSKIVLILIDVINDLEFDKGKDLLKYALPMAKRIVSLKERAYQAGIPCIYVNDNFGKWQSNFQKIICHCLHDDVLGKPLVEMLSPTEQDYFVLKPKHSAFYSTTLDTLLAYLGAQTLILTGVAGNICVLFTANDAYMRDYHLIIPSDCIASNTNEDNKNALQLMKTVLKADTRVSTRLDFKKI